ncbi:MAG: 7-cyano-7-deazaguanine synthase [Eggerthellaceae bacterium]|nr:7-cyano-7-deazaguanine synthase [Eggerthellaceae bacterium]
MAFSGGVDSAVSTRLLLEQGYNVEAATMLLSGNEDVESARVLAEKLEVKHRTVDFRRQFKLKIINNFFDFYSNGETPNPCIDCNIHFKFGMLHELAKNLGFDFLATGHYARISNVGGFNFIEKGWDTTKDQSYVLYFLKNKDLQTVVLPLGDKTKVEVKKLAVELGLFKEISESYDICFISDNDYISYFKQNPSYRPWRYFFGRRCDRVFK